MLLFDLGAEQTFNPERHVEKILGKVGEGDVTVACWEPGQVSPNHLHPNATEIYFCFSGGGVMRTPSGDVAVKPGSFVVHPRGELHEYVNGPERSLLFRVRYGNDMSTNIKDWPTNKEFTVKAEDDALFRAHPNGLAGQDEIISSSREGRVRKVCGKARLAG